MIYIDENPQEWANKHGITILKKECENCKQDIVCDVPIALKGYRGLEMRAHGCPEKFSAAVFVPIGEEKGKWDKLLFN